MLKENSSESLEGDLGRALVDSPAKSRSWGGSPPRSRRGVMETADCLAATPTGSLWASLHPNVCASMKRRSQPSRARPGLGHLGTVARCWPWRLHGWALLFWMSLAVLLGSRPVTAMNSEQNQVEGGTSPGQESKRATAQQAFEAAERLRSKGTAASLKSALEKYQEASELWREVGNQRREALALHRSGRVSDAWVRRKRPWTSTIRPCPSARGWRPLRGSHNAGQYWRGL